MSGIAGLFHLDGRPVEPPQISAMVTPLLRRGPDGSGGWRDGSTGLGNTTLQTTPESRDEQQPLVLGSGRLVITADARLDNREDLMARLGLHDVETSFISDARLIAGAYEKWNERCPEELLGDFAFAIWDAGRQRLFCARDCFGVRPLYVHHQPGRLFAFASEPAAILSLSEVPYRLNEGRIADFLVTQLEGIDTSCTFFEGISRLPPAHAILVDAGGTRQWRYWSLEPGPEMRLSSDDAYSDAFLEIFTDAVGCRLRGSESVGSMLSGGMDSGSIVAVASGLRRENGSGPLPVFSAIGPDSESCVETQAILAAQTMPGLEPHPVNHAELDDFLPELLELGWSADEPFDCHMTLVRAVYLCARRNGVKAVLDGIDGDIVLSEGSYLTRLMRGGHWLTAHREAAGQNRFWLGAYPAWRELGRSAIQAFVPGAALRALRGLRGTFGTDRLRRTIEESMISADFAERIHLNDRLASLGSHSYPALPADLMAESARAIGHPYLTVGVERYGRTASALGIEPRHPFLDRRLVEFCVALPGNQKLSGGWPKAILRSAMKGNLPDAVRRRRGKQNLGRAFTEALLHSQRENLGQSFEDRWEHLSPFVEMGKVRPAWRSFFEDGSSDRADTVFEALALSTWLRRHAKRPRAPADLSEVTSPI
ncbi:MAG: asparagine synthase-related protein [Acidobacteriota bacterium]|nr:asparagine synthase-related protein [Acidobacteriota bacterium]